MHDARFIVSIFAAPAEQVVLQLMFLVPHPVTQPLLFLQLVHDCTLLDMVVLLHILLEIRVHSAPKGASVERVQKVDSIPHKGLSEIDGIFLVRVDEASSVVAVHQTYARDLVRLKSLFNPLLQHLVRCVLIPRDLGMQKWCLYTHAHTCNLNVVCTPQNRKKS